ncbi:beta family protein [Lentzea rhizosphaerae]|uniref:Beta family protein n=1 Tax=Lentzea rhizosphaerae TaxID=2041025 RepID=A0ABV8BTN1_9PSEU
MPEPMYVPVLKGRQGELAALGRIQLATKNTILPVLEIAPPEDPDEPVAVTGILERTVKKVKDSWAGGELILDAGFVRSSVRLAGGQGVITYVIAKARSQGIGAIPVVRLSDQDDVRADVRAIHDEYRCGVAVRLSIEDMDEDPEDVDESLEKLLSDLNVRQAEADLILDLAVVNGDLAVRAGARMVLDVLRGLSDVDSWRRVIVTSGSFPVDLSVVAPWVFSEFQRYDAALWDAVRGRRRLPRIPLYGDYAITYPLWTSGPPFAPAPQLRYTLADRWLVLKGRKNDPRGNEQFYDVCERIAGHPEFAGAALGYADARIADPRAQGPGNGATWREIGTAHHLDLVARRITTLDEP